MARQKAFFVASELASFSFLAAFLATAAMALNDLDSGATAGRWAALSLVFGCATAVAIASTFRLGARYVRERRQEIIELIEPRRQATAST